MSELISGKEALIALANGESVEMTDSEVGMDWTVISKHGFLDEKKISAPCLPMFFEESENIQFRIKPRTITLNGIEVPAPFDAFNTGENELFWYLSHEHKTGYSYSMTNSFLGDPHLGAWRTKEEIKQVVAALRSVFGKK